MNTITINGVPCATGYEPANPPPVPLLHDWVRVSGSALTAQALRELLKTGEEILLIPGHVLRWSSQDVEN